MPVEMPRLRTAGRLRIIGLLAAVTLIAAACGDDDNPTPTSAPAGSPTATTGATAAPTATPLPADTTPAPSIDFSAPSTIDGADPEFNYTAMVWQGYWLSRDHFGPLAMGSGMGITFEPPMDMVQMAMQMVAQNPADQPFVPENLAPLMAVFKSGDTALLNDMMAVPPADFSGLRLDPSTFDTTVGVEGQAQLMLKESQWARNFHLTSHFGEPDADFGAQQRFMGMMVAMLAQMQAQFSMQELLNPNDGLYYDTDGTLDYRGNWTMLQALADLAGITGDETLRYFNPDMHAMFAGATAMLLQALESRQPADELESASAIRALAYVAWTADEPELRDRALGRVDRMATALAGRSPGDVVARSAAIAGLLSAAQALESGALAEAVRPHWEALSADFEPRIGKFASKDAYSTDDVAWIVGGLNSLVLGGPADLRAPAAATLLAFYEALLNQSGMQLAAPPGKSGAMSGPWEEDLPSIVYYHGRNTPPPPMAGGTFGRLTLPAAAVRYANGAWEVTDVRFESAGGMHLANELNWLGPHLGSVLFPPLNDDSQAHGADTSATPSTAITLRARDIAFLSDELVVPAGKEVAVTFVNEDESVPHNFHVTGPGGLDAKTEIFTGADGGSRTLTFTIAQPGEYTFVCDVHPSQMVGRLVAR